MYSYTRVFMRIRNGEATNIVCKPREMRVYLNAIKLHTIKHIKDFSDITKINTNDVVCVDVKELTKIFTHKIVDSMINRLMYKLKMYKNFNLIVFVLPGEDEFRMRDRCDNAALQLNPIKYKVVKQKKTTILENEQII